MNRLVPMTAVSALLLITGCSQAPENAAAPPAPPVDADKVAQARHGEDSPFLPLSFAEAQHRARTNDQPILIDFYTDWCGPCKQMDAHTWNQKKVIDWLDEHFVCIKYNATDPEKRPVAERYDVDSYPTMLLIDADGNELGRIKGGHDAQRLIGSLKDLLKPA
jgi:thiol:disulfide interchange protein